MKRFFPLILILATACTPFFEKVTPTQFTPPPPAKIAPANLNIGSSSEQIRLAMLNSALQWQTLHMSGTTVWYLPDGSQQAAQEDLWLDPLNARFYVKMTGVENSNQNRLAVSDGINIVTTFLNTGDVQTSPFPDSARVGQFVPPLQDGTAYPNAFYGQFGTPLAQLAFPSDYAQNQGLFTPLNMESYIGRQALIVEWRFSADSAPVWKFWLDTQTGLMLKLQQYAKDGSGMLESERAVISIEINPALDAALFAMPDGASAPQTGNLPAGGGPLVADSGPMSIKEAGEIYFFLQPRNRSGSIQLAKVSGYCVVDPVNCPPMQIVNTPFPFNFTINALSWSPDGRYAAFSYSDNPNGTPTKLWLLDASTDTWTSLAQFPYIDPPFWSPDGTWIAFRTQDGLGGEDVYVVHRDGTELKSISANLPAGSRPYIMDGWYTENVIMRPALPGSSGSIYLVRANDGQARPMFDTLLTKAQFIPSPDSSVLAYDDYDYNSQIHNIKIMEPDGANAKTLITLDKGSIYPMIWSPDSRFLAFNFYGNTDEAVVFLINRSAGEAARVYEGNTVGRLLFSPDGKYLLVEETTSITGGHLFVVNLATLEQNMLQAPGLSTDFDWYAPSWRK